MTLKQMRYTIAVARYKSFNEAAKRLYVSQPSLTGAVQGLEKELGFLIFKRNRSGVELTAEGKEYLNRIQAIVEQVDELETAYHNGAKPTDYFSVSAQHYNFPLGKIQDSKLADALGHVPDDLLRSGLQNKKPIMAACLMNHPQ